MKSLPATVKSFAAGLPLWSFFVGGVAAACYFAMGGVQWITAAVAMGLVSLGAVGGFVANRRSRPGRGPAPVPTHRAAVFRDRSRTSRATVS